MQTLGWGFTPSRRTVAGCVPRGRVGGLREGCLEQSGPFPQQQHEPVSSRRCDESCLSCEGSSRNCSRCKTGFTLLGSTCITNHTCSNGERPGAAGVC